MVSHQLRMEAKQRAATAKNLERSEFSNGVDFLKFGNAKKKSQAVGQMGGECRSSWKPFLPVVVHLTVDNLF